MNALTAVIPYRTDPQGVRRRNLEIILHWLESAGLPIVLSEHSDDPDPSLNLSQNVVRVHVAASGKAFNKAAACNAGFIQVTSALVALVDADTLMPMDAFLESAAAVPAELDVVRPYGRLIELDENATASIASGAPLPEGFSGERDDSRQGEHIPLCGGLVILRSSAYESVGGMDPTFQGWGGEDDALSAALIRTGLRCGINTSAPAFHLSHPRSVESRYGHEHYRDNLARAAWWHEAPDQELTNAITAGRESLQRARA